MTWLTVWSSSAFGTQSASNVLSTSPLKLDMQQTKCYLSLQVLIEQSLIGWSELHIMCYLGGRQCGHQLEL